MSSLSIKVYEIFKNKLGEAEASTVIDFIEEASEKKYADKRELLATKEDIALVRKEMAEGKSDIIKWMFIFWTGTVITILGGLFAFLKLFLDK